VHKELRVPKGLKVQSQELKGLQEHKVYRDLPEHKVPLRVHKAL